MVYSGECQREGRASSPPSSPPRSRIKQNVASLSSIAQVEIRREMAWKKQRSETSWLVLVPFSL
jgi:hypothetical protein